MQRLKALGEEIDQEREKSYAKETIIDTKPIASSIENKAHDSKVPKDVDSSAFSSVGFGQLRGKKNEGETKDQGEGFSLKAESNLEYMVFEKEDNGSLIYVSNALDFVIVGNERYRRRSESGINCAGDSQLCEEECRNQNDVCEQTTRGGKSLFVQQQESTAEVRQRPSYAKKWGTEHFVTTQNQEEYNNIISEYSMDWISYKLNQLTSF